MVITLIIFLQCMDIKLNLFYYTSIMPDSFRYLLCSKYAGIRDLGLPTVLLTLYLEIVLTENYVAVKFMVDG